MSLSEKALKIKEYTLALMGSAPQEEKERALLFAPALAALYGAVLKLKTDEVDFEDRDRLIMGSVPCRAAHWAALAEKGFFPAEKLSELCAEGNVPGEDYVVDIPGRGLAIAVDSALKARNDIKIYRSFLLIDEADCLRGALWESAIVASENMLDDLVVILCRPAGDILPGADNICAKFSAFGFDTLSVDGSNPDAIALSLLLPRRSHKPLFVCCDVK